MGERAGKAYLLFSASLSEQTISLSSADHFVVGERAFDYAGFAVSGVGDIDGDQVDDILISAKDNDDGAQDAGKTYLIFGASLAAQQMNLSAADLVILGENENEKSARSAL